MRWYVIALLFGLVVGLAIGGVTISQANNDNLCVTITDPSYSAYAGTFCYDDRRVIERFGVVVQVDPDRRDVRVTVIDGTPETGLTNDLVEEVNDFDRCAIATDAASFVLSPEFATITPEIVFPTREPGVC